MVKLVNCIVAGCNSNKDTPNHTFPNPLKHPERFRQWLSLCGNREILTLTSMTIHTTRRICYKHFTDIDRIGGRVRKKVLPTLNLPEPIPIEEVFPSLASTPQITPLDVGSLSKEETTIPLSMHTLQSSWEDYNFDTSVLEAMPVSVYEVEFRKPNSAYSASELQLSPDLKSPSPQLSPDLQSPSPQLSPNLKLPSPSRSPLAAPTDYVEELPVKKCKTQVTCSESDLNQKVAGLLNFVHVTKNGELLSSEKFACKVDNKSHKKSECKSFKCKRPLELAIEVVPTDSFELMCTKQLEAMKKQLRQNGEEIRKSNEKINKLEEEIIRKELIWAKEKKEMQERLNALENRI